MTAISVHYSGSDFFLPDGDLSAELLADLKDCGRPGPADNAVAYVLKTYAITGDPEDCLAYLAGYGAWEPEELEDHDTNLSRLVWLTGCALAEGEEAYFCTY